MTENGTTRLRDRSEASNIKLFLDGILQGEANISEVGSLNTLIPFSIGNLDRGSYGDRSEFFNGSIDDVLLESGALTATQVMMRSNMVKLDNTKPTLYDVNIASSNPDPSRAKSGDLVTLDFTVSEVINTLSVKINNISAAITGDGTSWTAQRTLGEVDQEGEVSFSVSFTDKSGNAGDVVMNTTPGSGNTAGKYVATPVGYACRTEAQIITSASECQAANKFLGNVHSYSFWSDGTAHEYQNAAYLPEGCLFMDVDSRGLKKGLNYHTHNRGFSNDVREAELSNYIQYANIRMLPLATQLDIALLTFVGLVLEDIQTRLQL